MGCFYYGISRHSTRDVVFGCQRASGSRQESNLRLLPTWPLCSALPLSYCCCSVMSFVEYVGFEPTFTPRIAVRNATVHLPHLSDRRSMIPQPIAWKAIALPIELLSHFKAIGGLVLEEYAEKLFLPPIGPCLFTVKYSFEYRYIVYHVKELYCKDTYFFLFGKVKKC